MLLIYILSLHCYRAYHRVNAARVTKAAAWGLPPAVASQRRLSSALPTVYNKNLNGCFCFVWFCATAWTVKILIAFVAIFFFKSFFAYHYSTGKRPK